MIFLTIYLVGLVVQKLITIATLKILVTAVQTAYQSIQNLSTFNYIFNNQFTSFAIINDDSENNLQLCNSKNVYYFRIYQQIIIFLTIYLVVAQ